MRAFTCTATALACLWLASSHRSAGADDQVKKWLVGRWAPEPEKPVGGIATAPKAKAKGRAKKAAGKAPAELPKCVIEFTKDGAIRLDGDTSALGSSFRFIKPLANLGGRVSPQTRTIKINYKFSDDQSIEVVADHSWLLDKLSGGGPIPPDKIKQLNEEYHPRETLSVAASSKTLTLTNAEGQSLKFRRYTGRPLAEEEARRTEAELRKGLEPLSDILRQQGINVGAPEGKAPRRQQ
jgi:hypothetical protein